jgi:glycosyltransferase involved in cell wall biosynthesis
MDTRLPHSESLVGAGDVGLPEGGVWVTWEKQRRTVELSRRLQIPLICLLHPGPRWRRYLSLVPATIRELWRQRPSWLVVQNPSILLAVVACILRPILGFRLIVDRHTNFMLGRPPSLRKRLFTLLSRWTLRSADLTIVTNEFLADIVQTNGGRPFVLQDPLPDIETPPNDGERPDGHPRGLFICTFAPDEPYCEVIRAMDALPSQWTLSITGRPPAQGFPPDVQAILDRRANIRLTGFIPDREFFRLMASSDFVVVLTLAEHCLVCGAYEALALRRPFVLSDRTALRDYFGSEVPRYVGDRPDSIATGLAAAFAGDLPTERQIEDLRAALIADWRNRYADLTAVVRGWFVRHGSKRWRH